MTIPRDRLELIVVDDGSADAAAIAAVVGRHGARLLVNDHNRGQSYSRNRAASEATGEILALIDSDCVASVAWLRELIAYFAWDRVGAVGGRTTSYYAESRARPIRGGGLVRSTWAGICAWRRGAATPSTFPPATYWCGRSVYQALGGLREDLRMGEDVDFCWRLRAQGHYLVYAPEGIVRHKHRNSSDPDAAAAGGLRQAPKPCSTRSIPTSASASPWNRLRWRPWRCCRRR